MNDPLEQFSEDEIIARLSAKLPSPPPGVVGIGDDCAVLPDGTLLKTDCVVEGRHYLPGTPLTQVAYKAVARVLSDFAAMGGEPRSLLLTLGLKKSTSLDALEKAYEEINTLLSPFDAHLLGGETTLIPDHGAAFLSVAGTGWSSRPVLRTGAKVGDHLYVTGELGNSFSSQHHLHFTPRVKEGLWLNEQTPPTAMMDLSDGLARDLPRLAKKSQVGYTLTLDALPLRAGANTEGALKDGEDYELLFTLPALLSEKLLSDAPFRITRIGSITQDTPAPLEGGWDHFTGET